MAGLAIPRYPDDPGYYLFSCAAGWSVFADTWHETLEGASRQAEFEYEGIGGRWDVPAGTESP